MMFGIKETVYSKPLINENIISTQKDILKRTQPMNYKSLLRYITSTPELIGMIESIVTDLMSDGYDFIPVRGDNRAKKFGERNVRRAHEFYTQNLMQEQLAMIFRDELMLGNGYLWKGKTSEKHLKKQIKELTNNFDFQSKKASKFLYTAAMKEFSSQGIDLFNTKRVEALASSSIRIGWDRFKTEKYIQSVGTDIAEFSPEEIIHFRYMYLDGKQYGFTPAKSLLAEMEMLGNLKDSIQAYFSNGGSPIKAYILPKESHNSPNHKALIQQLREKKNVQSWYGNLVFTGDIEIKDISAGMKEMQFQDLALYITGLFALAWNVPISRIPFLLGKQSQTSSADSQGDAAYWRKISAMQTYTEDLLNTKLFVPEYGVKFRFKRGYKQDEVRESQILTMNLSALDSMLNLGIKLTPEKVRSMLCLRDEDIELIKLRTGEEKAKEFQQQIEERNIGKDEDKDIPGKFGDNRMEPTKAVMNEPSKIKKDEKTSNTMRDKK